MAARLAEFMANPSRERKSRKILTFGRFKSHLNGAIKSLKCVLLYSVKRIHILRSLLTGVQAAETSPVRHNPKKKPRTHTHKLHICMRSRVSVGRVCVCVCRVCEWRVRVCVKVVFVCRGCVWVGLVRGRLVLAIILGEYNRIAAVKRGRLQAYEICYKLRLIPYVCEEEECIKLVFTYLSLSLAICGCCLCEMASVRKQTM